MASRAQSAMLRSWPRSPVAAGAGGPGRRRVLRISADPNNLPFTNERREGFENKIAELLAREMDADVQYAWRAQRRGFFREALKEGECDLVLGVPLGLRAGRDDRSLLPLDLRLRHAEGSRSGRSLVRRPSPASR